MGWLEALAIISIVSGITFTVVVLLAVRSLRRSLDEGGVRQAQQIKRLIETVTLLNQQQQSAHQKIQLLAETNRRLGEEVTALYERMGEGVPEVLSTQRLLN